MAEVEYSGNRFKPLTTATLFFVESRIDKENVKRKELEEQKQKVFHKSDCKDKDKGPKPAFSFQEGKRLPVALAAVFDESLIRRPLEEIDTFYDNEQTFAMLNKRNEIYRFNSDKSLGLLTPLNPVRKCSLAILTHEFFPGFILTIIAIHFIFMTIPSSSRATSFVDIAFTLIYLLELIIKVVGRGFVSGKFTYLRDPWNWLDFLLLIIALLTLPINGHLGNFAPIRTLRLLRVGIPGLDTILAAIFRAIKNLRVVLIFMVLFHFVISVIGLQIYMGLLTNKCVREYSEEFSDSTSTSTHAHAERENRRQALNLNSTNWLLDSPDNGQYRLCGFSYGKCPDGYTCLSGYGMNPDYGYTSFDTIGWAFLSTVRLSTQDYWDALYHQVLVTAGLSHMTFFIMAIFLSSFYLVNFIIATVVMSFKEVSENMTQDNPGRSPSDNQTGGKPEDDEQLTKDIEEDKGWFSRYFNVLTVWDCGNPWRNMQSRVASIVSDNPFFELFIATAIVINTLFMAMDHYGLQNHSELQGVLKIVFKIFLHMCVIEAALKIFAMGPKSYFQSSWNSLDFIVTFMMVIEALFEHANLPAFSVFRAFRLIMYYPEALREILGRTTRAIGNLIFASLIITGGMFGVLGMQLFGNNYKDRAHIFPSGEIPRWNFTDFCHSWMLVFRAICGEWIETMWDCMLVGDASCIPFLFAVVFIGGFVILPLSLALVLRGAYQVSALDLNSSAPSKLQQAFRRIGGGFKRITNSSARTHNQDAMFECQDQPIVDLTKQVSPLDAIMELESPSVEEDHNHKLELEMPEPEDENVKVNVEERWPNFRLKTSQIIQSKFFDIAVFLIILLSCTALTFEDIDLKGTPKLQDSLHSLNIVFAILFLFEAVVKLIGLGFKKYFTNCWCAFEFCIVVVTLFNVAVPLFGFGEIRIFTAMRSLRALRFLMFFSRKAEVKIVLNTLVSTIWPLLKVLPVTFLFWLVFAIMGVHLFNGKFFKCVDSEGNRPDHRQMNKERCEMGNYSWINSPMNFDHLGNSFLSLLQVATFKGWISIMNDAIDSRGFDDQPVREVNFGMYIFFVVFIIFGAFLTRSLFASVIIIKYLESVEESTENEYKNVVKAAKTRKPLKTIAPPSWRPQLMLFNFVNHWKFEAIFMIFICINVFVMSLGHYHQTSAWDDALSYLSLAFIAIFAAEAVIKMAALKCYYFTRPWNIFDFIVAVLSVLSLMLPDLIEKYFISPTLLRIIRICRISRAFGPFKWSKSLRTLIRVLTLAFPSLIAIMIILFLLLFVYAIFGMTYFQNVKLEGGLDETLNFQTFGSAMAVMFQLSTAAGWDGIMSTLARSEDCNSEKPGNCGEPAIGIAFLVSYVAICWYFISSMFLAVNVANYSKAKKNSEEGITDDDIDTQPNLS